VEHLGRPVPNGNWWIPLVAAGGLFQSGVATRQGLVLQGKAALPPGGHYPVFEGSNIFFFFQLDLFILLVFLEPWSPAAGLQLNLDGEARSNHGKI
jgi:hypothetical protein